MEVVKRLPKPADPVALSRLLDAQSLLCARFVSEEDCHRAVEVLQSLAAPSSDGGFDYFPALLTLASLHEVGFEPGISKDEERAAIFYLQFLSHERSVAASERIDLALLEEAATQMCGIVRDGKARIGEAGRLLLTRVIELHIGTVASWARFALAEVERQIREDSEEPEVRAQRLARDAARAAARQEETDKQRSAAREALAAAELLRLEGNDLCRQGQLPGNANSRQQLDRASLRYAEAVDTLSACVPSLTMVPEETAEVRRQRGLLLSNAAQVRLDLADWSEARQLASRALDDDSENDKARYRVGKAMVGQRNWEAAAACIDEALVLLSRRRQSSDVDNISREFWKLAQDVSVALPLWKWSCARPQEGRTSEDFEKRILGLWSYGNGTGCYEVKLEPWGALIWKEESMRIDLMRKGKLRWRGELEMISGMILNLSFEPGSDVLVSTFDIPADIPEEQRWKGPTRFTATRVPVPAKPPGAADGAEKTEIQEHGAAALTGTMAEPRASSAGALSCAAAAEAASSVHAIDQKAVAEEPFAGVPQKFVLVGCYDGDKISGQYELLQPDKYNLGGSGTIEASLLNGRPVYRRLGAASSEERFLWYRGGNWVVTAQIHASSLAAPFLARCGDPTGRSRHPLEVRRPRWYFRTGKGQEVLDPDAFLTVDQFVQPSIGIDTDATVVPGVHAAGGAASEEVPSVVEISGRQGMHEEVNGRYSLRTNGSVDGSPVWWSGRPVYWHEERVSPSFALFYHHGYWVVAPEVRNLPRALARRRCAVVPSPSEEANCADGGHGLADRHPAVASGDAPWEFLGDNVSVGHMIASETRTYAPDRSVFLCLPLSQTSADGNTVGGSTEPHGSIGCVSQPTAAIASDCVARMASTTQVEESLPTSSPCKSKQQLRAATNLSTSSPIGVADTSESPTVAAESVSTAKRGGTNPAADNASFEGKVLPAWVKVASAEQQGSEVVATIVAQDGTAVDMACLDLEIAPEELRVTLGGHPPPLKLRLPAIVDVEAGSKARWSEKTRALKVRFKLSKASLLT
eukprot:TRINITY_DN26504_c0_g1_i1.p1 TRINITY_DN26504_c0_g1~~TRINITY_DN26504_c0_g1_i1.p1  ORF type:complete len:1037 (-),score=176.99 TRINITY_DN26504_c0_g1_i1:184-3294(-)